MKTLLHAHPTLGLGLLGLSAFCLLVSPASAADYFHLGGSDGSRIGNAGEYSNTNGSATVATVAPGSLDDLFFYNSLVTGPFDQRLELGAANKLFNSLTFGSNAGTTQIDRGPTTSTSKNILGLNGGGLTVAAGAGPVTFGRLADSGNNQGVTVGVYQNLTVANNSSSDLTFNREFDGRGTAQRTVTVAGSGDGDTTFRELRSYSNGREIAMNINKTSGDGIVRFDVGTTDHDFVGATTVTAGTLVVDGNVTNSVFTVKNGGILGGIGTITNAVTFETGAQLLFNDAAALTINGAVSFGGFGIGNVAGLDSLAAEGTYNLIVGTGAIDFTNVTNLGLANAFDLGGGKSAYFQEGSLQLVVVPEPGSLALLLAFGASFLVIGSRRQARN